MAITVNIYDAKTRLSALVSSVEAGEEVVIARNGKPVARMVGIVKQRPNRTPGPWRDQVVVAADFDDFSAKDAQDWYGSPAT